MCCSPASLAQCSRPAVLRMGASRQLARPLFLRVPCSKPACLKLWHGIPAPSCARCRLHHRPTEAVLGKQLNRAARYVQANKEWLPQLVWMDTPPQVQSVVGHLVPLPPLGMLHSRQQGATSAFSAKAPHITQEDGAQMVLGECRPPRIAEAPTFYLTFTSKYVLLKLCLLLWGGGKGLCWPGGVCFAQSSRMLPPSKAGHHQIFTITTFSCC